MKKFLKNLLMKHLIDIVINQSFNKKIIFLNLINNILYLNSLKYILTGYLKQKSINKY